MSSIFAKGRVIALATVHSLLDQSIDVMSIPVMRQYIRDLEEARENMEGQLVEQRETYRRAGDKADANARQITELTGQARLLKAQGKMDSALALAGQLNALEEKAKTFDLAGPKTAIVNLEKVVASLKAKEAKMKADLERLERLDATAKNSERAAAAIKSVASVMETGSVDNLAEKIENRAAKASGKLEAAMGSLNSDVDADVEKAKAEARLASL
jgi:phage shock protein A